MRYREGYFSWKGFDINPLGGNRVKINGEDNELTSEIQTAFTDLK